MTAELSDEAVRARAKAMLDARASKGPGDVEKEGFFTGAYTVNPFSGENVVSYTDLSAPSFSKRFYRTFLR